MSSTIGNLKDLIAIHLGRTTAADLTVNGFDIGMFALNSAKRKVERAIDFRYSEAEASISIASTGTLITSATGLDTGSRVKRVITIDLPVAASEYIPVEFLTLEAWRARLAQQIGNVVYNAAATIANLGVYQDHPIAYQEGQKLYLVPASQFNFPVVAKAHVVRFLPDYSDNANTDFFTEVAPEYLLWQAVLEANKHFQRFAPKQEGAIDEDAISTLAQEALSTLIAWNDGLNKGTSTPPGTGVPKKG